MAGTWCRAGCRRFFVAFKFPNFFRRLFAEGAFNAAFVPMFGSVWRRVSRSRATSQRAYCLDLSSLVLLGRDGGDALADVCDCAWV